MPQEITTLTNLISLDLTNNQLTALPPEIINLTNLASLDLSNNELTSVPPEVINLTGLTSLAISNNLLTSLPLEIVRLANLTRFHLGGVQLSIGRKRGWGVSGNRLTRIPSELFTCTKLVDLDLCWNQLTSLAPEIAQLTNLTKLRLRRNQFTSVPTGILKLTNLTFLDLSGNHLTSVPTEITKLTKLTSLDLRETQLPIVRINQYIQEHHYWKNGVFLHDGENRAKVKADLVDRKIFISVIGKEQTRRAFLAVIRSAFDEINSNFKIDIEQKIPVPGFPQVLISYKDLLAYEDENEQSIFIPELRKKFPVRELLDGVEELSTRMERREIDLDDKGFRKHIAKEIQSNRQPRILRIVLASPSDVQAERDVLPSVIDEVNRGVATDRGLRLELSRWETDSYAGFHPEGPQGLIDPILKISECDLLIGIFWKRFGTPTPDGKTGTEHEFSLAYEAWREKQSPQIFVYFNQKAYTPKSKAETEQWGQVLGFMDKFPKEGLWWPYKGKPQFEKLVRTHLTNYIRTLSNSNAG